MNNPQTGQNLSQGGIVANRVLVVDDDHDFADSLKELLELHSFEAETAYDPDSAQALNRDFGPAVALVDVHLGRSFGTDLIPKLKADHPDLLCILITANADLDTAMEAVKLGAYDYLRKPLNNGQLISLLNRCFQHAQLKQERAEALLLLQEHRHLLQTVIDTIPHDIFVTDTAGRISLVNTAFSRNHGVAAESAADNKISAYLTGTAEEKKYLIDLDRQVLESGNAVNSVESVVTSPDGRTAFHNISRLPVRDSEMNITGLVGMSENITLRKQLEQDLRQSQTINAIGQIAGGVAHEFNNLLQIITGFNTLMRDELPPGSDSVENVDRIADACSRGANLVNKLLSFSQRQLIKPITISVNEFLMAQLETERIWTDESIEVILELESAATNIKSDPGALRQIVKELCANAEDAIQGRGAITIKTTRIKLEPDYCAKNFWAHAGEYIRIAISDTGCGMTDEQLEHIFEPFYTTKGPQKGTGLGMSMIKGLVELHRGLLNVYTSLGSGTTIEVYFPVKG